MAVGMGSKSKQILLQPLMLLLTVISVAGLAPRPAEGLIAVESTSSIGIIKGVVRDHGGSPIAEASVAIFRSGTSKLLKQVSSGSDGSFIAKIVPGTYTVLAVAQGFNPVTLYGVQVNRAAELTYGFNLERAGSGNTLPEKRLDRNSSKWRIRAAQSRRSVYQNQEGGTVAEELDAAAQPDLEDDRTVDRKGQTVVETYVAESSRGSTTGVNVATLIPVGESSDLVVAAQGARGGNSPQRVEVGFTTTPVDGHKLRLNGSVSSLGNFSGSGEDKGLGQFSFQVLDEWKVREGIILVFGLDYSRFMGASDDFSISPRLGFQYDINSKTRFRSAFTTQTEERSWANALELEGHSVAFREPVAIEDLFVIDDKPQMNRSSRLEFGIERILDDRSTLDANVFVDTTPGRGVGLNAFAFDNLGGDGFEDFVADQQGRARGIRVVYTRRMGGPFTVSAGYAFGNGQKLSTGGLTDPSRIFENDFFSSFFAQVAAELKTGTSVRTVYRLSPEATVFAIDPFKGSLAIYDPGLSVLVTQHLPTLGLPFRAEAVIDARNLFDTQAVLSGDEGTLKMNAQGRILRGGIKVRF